MSKWINDVVDPQNMTNEEIRQYCLRQARTQLSAPVGGRHSDNALERAARYATIAQAFRDTPEVF